MILWIAATLIAFFIKGLCGLYGIEGILSLQILKQAVFLMPLMLAGLFLGMGCSKILDEKVIKKLVILMLIVSGVALVVKSL